MNVWNFQALGFTHSWVNGNKVRIKSTAVIHTLVVDDDDDTFDANTNPLDPNQYLSAISAPGVAFQGRERVRPGYWVAVRLSDGIYVQLSAIVSFVSSG